MLACRGSKNWKGWEQQWWVIIRWNLLVEGEAMGHDSEMREDADSRIGKFCIQLQDAMCVRAGQTLLTVLQEFYDRAAEGRRDCCTP